VVVAVVGMMVEAEIPVMLYAWSVGDRDKDRGLGVALDLADDLVHTFSVGYAVME